MRKVIFLDRDGVINFEPGDYTYKIDKFKIIEGLFDALNILQNKGFEFIVITNQGGISKGIYNHNDVNTVHNYMQQQFSNAGIQLLAIYYCPHHAINEKCICRKPNSLMLEKAVARYEVDKKLSYFIGDSNRDVLAAKNVAIKGIQIVKNDNLSKYLNQII